MGCDLILNKDEIMNKKLLEKINNAIVIDIKETWTKEMLDILDNNKNDLSDYYRIEQELTRKSNYNDNFMFNNTSNDKEAIFNEVCLKLREELFNKKIIGFHCSRLTNEEINNIKIDGLRPLTSNLIEEKLDILVRTDLISQKEYDYLLENNVSAQKNRSGMVMNFFSIDTLKDCGGLSRLFRAWGGESIYYNNESIIEWRKLLFRIGKPVIILCSLKYTDINAFTDLEKLIIQHYIQEKIYDTNNISKVVVNVKNVITIEEELFEYLTNYSAWEIDKF